MIATAARMTTEAMIVRRLIGSARKIVPSATATTGFT